MSLPFFRFHPRYIALSAHLLRGPIPDFEGINCRVDAIAARGAGGLSTADESGKNERSKRKKNDGKSGPSDIGRTGEPALKL